MCVRDSREETYQGYHKGVGNTLDVLETQQKCQGYNICVKGHKRHVKDTT